MGLQFNPPDWVVQEYINRKTPYQEASIGLQTALQNYLALDEAKRRNITLQRESDQRQTALGLEAAKMGYDPNNPQAYWDQFNAEKERAGKLTDSQIKENEARAKYYENKPNIPTGMGKPQLRQNAFTGEWEWYQPPIPGSTTPTPSSPTGGASPVSHGPGTFRDKSKAAGAYAEESSMVDSVVSEIDRVKELNKNSRGGFGGALLQKGQSALNVGTDSPEFTNTADVVNTLKNQVARVLKSTFGGQLSDDERRYLNEVYGAADRMTPAERNIAMTNVTTMLRAKRNASGAKLSALSGNVNPQTSQTGGSDRVSVVSPDGKSGNIPRSQLDEALKNGYRLP